MMNRITFIEPSCELFHSLFQLSHPNQHLKKLPEDHFAVVVVWMLLLITSPLISACCKTQYSRSRTTFTCGMTSSSLMMFPIGTFTRPLVLVNTPSRHTKRSTKIANALAPTRDTKIFRALLHIEIGIMQTTLVHHVQHVIHCHSDVKLAKVYPASVRIVLILGFSLKFSSSYLPFACLPCFPCSFLRNNQKSCTALAHCA